jgi:hypothetical protein
VLRPAGGQPGEATGTGAALGGAAITGDRNWDGTVGTAAGRTGSGHHPDVPAVTAAVVRIRAAADPRPGGTGTFDSSQVVMRYGGHLSDRRSLERRHI